MNKNDLDNFIKEIQNDERFDGLLYGKTIHQMYDSGRADSFDKIWHSGTALIVHLKNGYSLSCEVNGAFKGVVTSLETGEKTFIDTNTFKEDEKETVSGKFNQLGLYSDSDIAYTDDKRNEYRLIADGVKATVKVYDNVRSDIILANGQKNEITFISDKEVTLEDFINLGPDGLINEFKTEIEKRIEKNNSELKELDTIIGCENSTKASGNGINYKAYRVSAHLAKQEKLLQENDEYKQALEIVGIGDKIEKENNELINEPVDEEKYAGFEDFDEVCDFSEDDNY